MEFPDLDPIAAGPGPATAAANVPVSRTIPAAAAPAPAGAASAPRLIPAAEWRAHCEKHRGTPALFAALPDGSPLRLTPAGVQFYEQVTGTLLWPTDAREAAVLLWAASLPAHEQEALWLPQEPLSLEESAGFLNAENTRVIPGLSGQELTLRFLRWQRAVIPPAISAAVDVQTIALALWNHENATAVEIDEDALPEIPDDNAGTGPEAEKKNPAPLLTGSPASATPSAEATSPAGPPSYFTPATAPSSPPTPPGSPPPVSPSSPPPIASAAAGTPTPACSP